MGLVVSYSALTGGTTDALDSKDGALLTDKDMALVTLDGNTYIYELDSTHAGNENSPYVISPDDNAGNKRWVLQRLDGYPYAKRHAFDTSGCSIVTLAGKDLTAEVLLSYSASASCYVVAGGYLGKQFLVVNYIEAGNNGTMWVRTSATATGVAFCGSTTALIVHNGTDYVKVTSAWAL